MINYRFSAERIAEALTAIEDGVAKHAALQTFRETFPEFYWYLWDDGTVDVEER